MAVEVARGIFNLDTDTLCKVPDISRFQDALGYSLCDYFNKEGGLILVAGKKVPSSVAKMAVFVKRSVYNSVLGITTESYDYNPKETLADEQDPSFKALTQEVSKLLGNPLTVSACEEMYGKNTVSLATQAMAGIEEIMCSSKATKNTLSMATDIVEETYKIDRFSLNGCINALRSVDSYTYNHSFGVYLLFSQALEDFKNHMSRPIFYETFKKLNSNVNFNLTSLKHYATAALLHDFGKRNIPKEIISKNGKLTDEEYDIIKYHPKVAVKEFYDMGIDDPVFLEIIGNHHRNYLTFPKKGQSALAQICNIVDIYEACRSKRSYKNEQSFGQTQVILLDEQKHFGQDGWESFIFITLMKETFPKFDQKRLH